MCAARVTMDVNIYVHNYLYVCITHFKLGEQMRFMYFLKCYVQSLRRWRIVSKLSLVCIYFKIL